MSKNRTGKGIGVAGQYKRTPEIRKKISDSVKQLYKDGVYDGVMNPYCVPRYNPEACEIINWYNMYYDLNFQHAENGGEVRVLKYYPDGYDKERNIVIEIDEKYHQYPSVQKKDIQRQKEITDHLGCEFIRVPI